MSGLSLLPAAWQGSRLGKLRHRPRITLEALALLTSGYFAVTANASFWSAAVPDGWKQWALVLALTTLVLGLHGFLLGLLLIRIWAKPLLSALLIATAFTSYFTQSYGIYLDGDMLRNVLHTDWPESRELLTAGLALHVTVYAGLPIAVLWRLDIVARPPVRGLLVRTGFLFAMAVTVVLSMTTSFKEVSSLIRNHREIRYLLTPANILYGIGSMVLSRQSVGGGALLPVAEDARLEAMPGQRRPRLVVLVVGETVRAQNWGLNGYVRQTTPELAHIDAVNFRNTRACGTSTEISLPCMFSPFGRRDYDMRRIRTHQSFLHVLQRVGVDVMWRDNQSGCKGVCEGLPFEFTSSSGNSELCSGSRCLDEVLLKDFPTHPSDPPRDRLVVLHMLGNHGPSYYQRYPDGFRQFLPACEYSDLGLCTREEIVNAYDNAVLYTDHVLARTIAELRAVEGFDTAMIFLSDHGESLGEGGLYLHGVPYAIAPEHQKQVPMLMWFSPRFQDQTTLDMACLRERAESPASHDDLFSTVLGLFDVQTSSRDPEHDLLTECRLTGSHDERRPYS